MKNRGHHGFTLIELLIVVVIIGILASIAIPKFSSVREKAFRASMMSDLRNLAHLQEIYFNDNYIFAGTTTAAQAIISDGVTLQVTEATNMGWAATATHQTLPGEQCGVYHGSAAAANGSPGPIVGVVGCSF